MFKIRKAWSVLWQGHTITVENWWTPALWCGETLLIDGRVVETRRGWGKITESLQGHITENGSRYSVRARLGCVCGRFRSGCHITVDDEPVGGDLDDRLLF